MKIEIFTFCDFAQENSGKLTIIGTFDTIIARTFPCIHPQLFVVIRIRFNIWEFSRHTFRIESRDLNGDMCMDTINGNLVVNGASNATTVSHLIFTVSNLRFKNSGMISFALYMDDREIASVPLYVRKG